MKEKQKKKQKSIKIWLVFFGILSLSGLTACGQKSKENGEVLTQKVISPDRTPITVLVKYAFSINSFEKAVEEKFPDIDIVQVGNYTKDMGIAEYESRLEHGDLTDVVMTWPLDVGEEYWEEQLLDLSGMEFTSKYNLSMLNEISRDGKLYYLPGPAQVRGIVYNKTMFEENGWQVPSDYEGFATLCKEIEATGVRSLQLGFKSAEVLDTAFIGYNYGAYFSSPKDVQWIADYNQGKGSFGDHFSPALDVFQRMIDDGIFVKTDLDLSYSDREKMLFTRKCAMVEDSVLIARMGEAKTGTTDEFALMPFFNPSKDGEWARLYMVCYIGMNKQLAEPENKEKYDLVMKLMDYISTTEGQEALAGDTGAMFSSLIGAEPPKIPEIEPLLKTLNEGRYAIFTPLKNAQGALREGLAGMVSEELTKDDVIEMVDQQNLAPVTVAEPEVLGTAEEDFSLTETGNFVADAIRDYGGCDVGLFLDNGKDGLYNGKGISGRLYEGDITTLDISRILPDLKHGESGTMWKVTMTGADLMHTLEYAITVDNNITGWFYYVSGLKLEIDPTAEPGKRISNITLTDGRQIDPIKLYNVAVMDETLPEDAMQSCVRSDVLISTILEEAVKKAGSIAPSKDGRFVIVQE